MPKKKKTDPCGFEINYPHIFAVSCPACGFVFGKGGCLDTSNPCFNPETWPNKSFVVLEDVRIDRTATLVPYMFHPHKCEQCAVDRRNKDSGPWAGEERRFRSTVKPVDINLTGVGDE
jgi:hypothetical protein